MFNTETKTITTSHERSYGHAVCDRCGHVMDESDHRSGYNNLTMLRFRAGYGSKFGDGSYIEGDFCDACLFELLVPYVRVIDDKDVPDSEDFFRMFAPRRMFAEHQIAGAMAEGLFLTLGEWIAKYFDPKFTRHRVGRSPDVAPVEDANQSPSER
jgi:hypothetical protein